MGKNGDPTLKIESLRRFKDMGILQGKLEKTVAGEKRKARHCLPECSATLGYVEERADKWFFWTENSVNTVY